MQGEGPASGMAGSMGDPAALLRLYMKHGRLRDAAQLALSHLHAWRTQVSRPLACSVLHSSLAVASGPCANIMLMISACNSYWTVLDT